MAESFFRNDLLKDKVALITGGGSGICFGIAKALGTHGAKVAIMGRREQVLQDACKQLEDLGIETFYVSADVRDAKSCESAIESVVEKFGSLSILVNGAAGNFSSTRRTKYERLSQRHRHRPERNLSNVTLRIQAP